MKNNIESSLPEKPYSSNTNVENNMINIATENREGLKKLQKAYSLVW